MTDLVCSPPVDFTRRGSLGVITLDRPTALHALSYEMILSLRSILQAAAKDDGIRALVVRGTGTRAFCAGGDLRAVWDMKRAQGDQALSSIAAYFRAEYQMNALTRSFPKPYVALIDGITMGGGVGISVHGSHCVATENTVWAMPEVGIGFIPDAGVSHVLARLPDHLGLYLALVGARLGAADCLALGLATHTVQSAACENIIEDLAAAAWTGPAHETVDQVLRRHRWDPGIPPLAAIRDKVSACYGAPSVEGIFAALQQEGSPWAKENLALLSRQPPTSLKVVFRQIVDATHLSFEECLRTEFRLCLACAAGYDFMEGIRAQIIDKDRAPQWKPSNLSEIDATYIDACFEPARDREWGDLWEKRERHA